MSSTCPHHGLPMPMADPSFYDDPFATYDALIAEGPIHRMCYPDGTPIWLVTRYEEVAEGLRDPKLGRPVELAGPDFMMKRFPEGAKTGTLATTDPPEHTRLRNFITPHFRRDRIEAMEPLVQQVVNDLMDKIEAQKEDGPVDLVQALASPVPVAVVCELLGMPAEIREEFRSWVDIAFAGDDEVNLKMNKHIIEYFSELIEGKRKNPEDDLISLWIDQVGRDGTPLTNWEITAMAVFIVMAGYETTAGMISQGARFLLERPDIADYLREHPDRFQDAVEEMLRRTTSVHHAFRRFAKEDMVIAGQPVAKGDTVMLHLSAAGRDPVKFPDPDLFDIDREDKRHVAFGRGIHYCPGGDLARIEVRVALQTLITRFPGAKLAVPSEELKRRYSPFVPAVPVLPATV